MSLICVRNYDEMIEYRKNENRGKIGCSQYRNCFEIQKAFCNCIEREQKGAERRRKKPETKSSPFLFLESKEIQDYLGLYDIKYIGNFLLEGIWNSGWNELPKEEAEKLKSREFVTWLNYPLQLACIALSSDISVYVEGSAVHLLDVRYLKPVIEKKTYFA